MLVDRNEELMQFFRCGGLGPFLQQPVCDVAPAFSGVMHRSESCGRFDHDEPTLPASPAGTGTRVPVTSCIRQAPPAELAVTCAAQSARFMAAFRSRSTARPSMSWSMRVVLPARRGPMMAAMNSPSSTVMSHLTVVDGAVVPWCLAMARSMYNRIHACWTRT